ncbi:MAG: methyltransferase domain-containing protein [Nitrosopumilus sp.]|nr:methyltransferase domain-containing protein [Nitrosopumilus sp.]MDF2423102.1 methyltransferase domain-containing protein [Nitrosopumilus sp.]MDF2424268.1 methyltransferase domain-containing protein [Nitrosopumilus sp.]MDF2425376.1 methyltransferase domain-containing protein [Nitrosopumilus sp.]MDF2427080.1 methyltransferase domain-containing protein [Nitrosopumilus sp.]
MQTKFLKNEEYPPSEDTFFMVDNIENEKGNFALDVGSGSGYLTKLLSENFSFVVGTDINFDVLKDQTYKTENIVCCNGSDALRIKFDFIVCNLPYLATDEILDIATDGGKDGFEIPKKILDSVIGNMAENGRFVFVTSSLSDYQKLIEHAQKLGLKTRIIAKKKLFFEELILVEAQL